MSKSAYRGVQWVAAGMSVDIPSIAANPMFVNGGAEVNTAFLRIYGIDLKRAGLLNTANIDVQKV